MPDLVLITMASRSKEMRIEAEIRRKLSNWCKYFGSCFIRKSGQNTPSVKEYISSIWTGFPAFLLLRVMLYHPGDEFDLRMESDIHTIRHYIPGQNGVV